MAISFETSGTAYPAAQSHILETVNLQYTVLCILDIKILCSRKR